MSNGNSITLVGNITRDPELRFTPTGQAIATFGLAVNRRWKDRQSGEMKEAVSFFDVVCWREMAENASESLSKGARVIVTGRLEQRSWETHEGEKRSMVEVVADEIGPSLRWATAEVKKSERRAPVAATAVAVAVAVAVAAAAVLAAARPKAAMVLPGSTATTRSPSRWPATTIATAARSGRPRTTGAGAARRRSASSARSKATGSTTRTSTSCVGS